MIPKLTVYAKYLYLLMVLIVEINCFSQDVQLQSACSNKFVRVERDRVIANENSEYPQNFTIISDTSPEGKFRLTFYIKELDSYICFNKRWQPKLFKKLTMNCYFTEEMDQGYQLYQSIHYPGKYLGFNRNGKPINYVNPQKIDLSCRRIFKNGLSTSTTTIDYEPTSLANSDSNVNNNLNNNNNHPHRHHNHHHTSTTTIHQPTHSNSLDATKQRTSSSASSSSSTTTARRTKQQKHHVRHHHNEQPLRRPPYHTISNNKNLDSNDNMSSTKQLGNEDDFNAIYNHNDSGVNIVNESKSKQNARLRKPSHGGAASKPLRVDENLDRVQDSSSHNPPPSTNFNLENINNDTNNNNNCTDETDDKSLKGKRIVKGRNAANDKSNNKCNNNNRRHRKNNGNGRNSKRPNQKSSQSQKNQQQASP